MLGSTNSAIDFTPTLPKPKSILSKLAAPFTPMKRNLAEYYIKTNEQPRHRYSPGDRVKGAVVVTVTKPVRITHLALCLHGFAKVFTSSKLPGESVSREGALMGGGIGKRGAEYFGNGFASLFENEIILCGEGRLEVGSLEFQFDLELPSRGLPSSISFERGTISYMLTSTLTRPTTIGPIATCEHAIDLVEIVDIGNLPRPKPRVVSVETVSRKSITKIGARKSVKPSSIGKSPVRLSTAPPRSAIGSTSSDRQPPNEPTESPVPSTRSYVSAESSGASIYQRGSARPLARSSIESSDLASNDEVPDHVVTATMELLHRGCLPGDKLPVQISINHNKPVKSLQGIVITMYREGHVDTHPAIPLGPSQTRKKREYEDYYPKSRTGLGGLSLSSAGSSSGFRKDLSQRIVPLIVDPQTLVASAKTTIQVPEDLFPTISSVPGAMITFKYFVEVVIDLRGKLTGQDRFLPRLNMTSGASAYGYSDHRSNGMDYSEGFTGSVADGLDILLTEQLRREKGVVSCLFEVIVGTQDSRRKRGRPLPESRSSNASHGDVPIGFDEHGHPEAFGYSGIQRQTCSSWQDLENSNGVQTHDGGSYNLAHGLDYWQPDTIPPPIIEEDLDEKSRLRRAEERLLPSAPTSYSEPTSSDQRIQQPSAPEVYHDESFSYVGGGTTRTATYHNGAPRASLQMAVPGDVRGRIHTSFQANPAPTPPAGLQDDKQELERRRLQMAASSPHDHDDGGAVEAYTQSRRRVEPSAPIFHEDCPYQHHKLYESHESALVLRSHLLPSGDESLPLYQK